MAVAGSFSLTMLTVNKLAHPDSLFTFSMGMGWFLSLAAFLVGVGLFLRRNWGWLGAVLISGGLLLFVAWNLLTNPSARGDLVTVAILLLVPTGFIVLLNLPPIRRTIGGSQ